MFSQISVICQQFLDKTYTALFDNFFLPSFFFKYFCRLRRFVYVGFPRLFTSRAILSAKLDIFKRKFEEKERKVREKQGKMGKIEIKYIFFTASRWKRKMRICRILGHFHFWDFLWFFVAQILYSTHPSILLFTYFGFSLKEIESTLFIK